MLGTWTKKALLNKVKQRSYMQDARLDSKHAVKKGQKCESGNFPSLWWTEHYLDFVAKNREYKKKTAIFAAESFTVKIMC